MYLEISFFLQEKVLSINMMETLPSSPNNKKYKTSLLMHLS